MAPPLLGFFKTFVIPAVKASDQTPYPLQLNDSLELITTSGGGGGGAVTIADGADVAEGAKADAAYVSGTGSVIAILKGIFGKLPTLVSGRVPVDGSGVTQPISAAALPLPTGAATEASLSSAVTSLQIMDDWDETDRAKVNIIAGQVGVAGNSGTVDAATQRVVLATDVPLPAGTNAIGKLAANSGVDIGDVDVTSVPSDPFGANADAAATAGGTGSISAKLRAISRDLVANIVLAAGTNLIGRINNAASATVTGQTPFFDSSVDNSAQTMKNSAGNLYFLEVQNVNTTDCWLQIFDAASPSVGSTTPTLSLLVPAGDGTNRGAMDKFFDPPISFATAIKYAATTTATGSGNPSTALVLNAGYA